MNCNETDKLIRQINQLLDTPFERDLAKSSFDQLAKVDNKLRLNNFAYSLRELSRHILKRMSPDDKVKESTWYTPIKNNNGQIIISRKQRIKYAIQKSLSDKYVEGILGLELEEIIDGLKDSIDELSKYTHVNEDTFNCSDIEIQEVVNKVCRSFINLIQGISECRNRIVIEIEGAVNDEVVDKLFGETINEIDYLATHYEIEEYSIDSISLDDFEDDICSFRVNGSAYVRLQYGSDSDLKRGDGYEFRTSFPFESTLTTTLDNGELVYDLSVDEFVVDNDSFWG